MRQQESMTDFILFLVKKRKGIKNPFITYFKLGFRFFQLTSLTHFERMYR